MSTETTAVCLKHVCHLCKKAFKSPSGLRRHIGTTHKTLIPPRAPGGYYSLDGIILVNDEAQGAIDHFTCPSCWIHDPDFEWLKKHIPSHEIQQQDNVSVPIKTKKDTFHFRDASSSLHVPKRPKIASEDILTLSSIATIINPCNAYLSAEFKRIASQQIIDQANQVSLKQYPIAYNTLKQALDVELTKLPHSLWTFTQPDDITSHDATLVKIIQFVLTDFCSKCHRNPYFQPKNERTLWIDRVVPIFQTFGDHSQLLGFQWCEVPTEEHVEFTIDPNTWMRTATTKYHDGLGYDINSRSCLVMEGSSNSVSKENITHTQDDTVKTLHVSIEILNSFIRRHATASFSSLCSVVSFSVQCVCTTITLSTTTMDCNNVGAYIQKEVRSADIPLTFQNRSSWIHVFELVAYLYTSLSEQETILETIMKESSGLIPVKDSDRGLHVLAGIDTVV